MQSPLAESAQAMAGQSLRVLVWDRDLVDMWCLDQDGKRAPFRGKGSQWHFHPELELTAITRGDGALYVGDHIGRFTAPDCILLGGGLPHVWRSRGAMAGVSLQFALAAEKGASEPGAGLAGLAELAPLARWWSRARFGVRWRGATAARLRAQMLELEGRPALDRLARFLAILETMRVAPKAHGRQLSERVLAVEDAHRPADAMRRVLDHIMEHFREEVRLDALVSMSGRSQATFCRRFTELTGRTFTAYLNAIRIQEVRRQLVETRRSITDIAFATGFNNLSHFHAVFRATSGCAPREFRQLGAER